MAKGTILVVDDDPAIVEILQDILVDEGYDVVTAVGAGALRVAHDVRPDMILLDIRMPQMDGVEVSWRLRDDPVTANIPIIVMSAQQRIDITQPVLPAMDHLAKPFDRDHLCDLVARWIPALALP